jgi:hypothetical protein
MLEPPEEALTIISRLDLCSSSDRGERMLSEIHFAPSHIFWPVFLDSFPACDRQWHLRSALLHALEINSDESAWLLFVDAETREKYERLPELVTVFRGCSRARVRGLSWSLNRSVAATFARGHRNIRVPDPVIARATVRKPAIFALLTDRGEDEIVLNWRRLRAIEIEPFCEDVW